MPHATHVLLRMLHPCHAHATPVLLHLLHPCHAHATHSALMLIYGCPTFALRVAGLLIDGCHGSHGTPLGSGVVFRAGNPFASFQPGSQNVYERVDGRLSGLFITYTITRLSPLLQASIPRVWKPATDYPSTLQSRPFSIIIRCAKRQSQPDRQSEEK